MGGWEPGERGVGVWPRGGVAAALCRVRPRRSVAQPGTDPAQRRRGPGAGSQTARCARTSGTTRGRVFLTREVTRAARWSTESVPLRQVRHWSRPPQSYPVPYPGRAWHVPWVSIARWWATIQASSAGVADAGQCPVVQLRPLWSSGGDLSPLRSRPSLLRPPLRPSGAAGVARPGRVIKAAAAGA